ncbi:Sesquiterpene synthase [Melia azedarach]|uniref:Sesquiterpene synthase n=1 Tax=Melia azedarach TaxID=155640 RepID=A0ACC1YSN9_MELAZ|nr:Sesquiterpene synthase [Melia azedarach]
MSLQVSAASLATHNVQQGSNRRSANFHPSIWGDHFLSISSATDDSMETDLIDAKHLELKEEIRRMLTADINKLSKKKVDLIDAIQRLGVSYHFESEVDEILEKAYNTDHHNCVLTDDENIDDLYYISLQFRLLRQHGYKISADVFNNFKDSDGNFKSTLIEDARGMLSLYEATHLRVHGENILDEALAFTTKHFESMGTQFSTPLAVQIKHALKQPIHKGLQRLEARFYMSIYQEDPSHDQVLLTFAKLDFNKLQKVHQKELADITRWWKGLDFAHKLPFARDRVVECHFWILGVYFEQKYYLARRILTKIIAMTSVIDDIYDVYGTIEELELFTAAIERWDISAIHQLPEYMKLCYQALLDVYSEMEKDLAFQEKLYRLHYAKEAMKTVVKNYFLEAKWCHKKYVPKMDEYMTVALVTSAYPMLATTSFVGMGDIMTKEAFEWLFNNPKMVTASSVVCRLMDDIVSHKFEQKRGHVASSVECFMKQHGATEEEACNELQKQVTTAWKVINEECLRPTSVPTPLLMRILNLTRVIDVIYKDEDGYTHAGVVLKDYVSSLLINPVPI